MDNFNSNDHSQLKPISNRRVILFFTFLFITIFGFMLGGSALLYKLVLSGNPSPKGSAAAKFEALIYGLGIGTADNINDELVPSTPIAPFSSQKNAECIQVNIQREPFVSDKCYNQQDYAQLQYYLGLYNDAVYNYEDAVNIINITCGSNNTALLQSCGIAKADKTKATLDIETYKLKINELILKGK